MKSRLIILICVLLLSQHVWSMTSEEAAKIIASDGISNEMFGRSVAISGNTAIIGNPSDLDGIVTAGSVYVYVRSGAGWIEQAKLVPSDGEQLDSFGWSVSIDGDTAVIGAVRDEDYGFLSGSAYVFTRTGTTWSQQAKLNADDQQEEDRFGTSVSVSGDTVIIGTYRGGFLSTIPGAAYIFTRSGTNWTLQAKLTEPDGTLLPHSAGASVSIYEDTAVIGTPQDSEYGGFAGAAFVYFRSGTTWSQQAKLSASDRNNLDYFGGSVSIVGNTIIVGAHGNDDFGEFTGSAYVYTRTGTNWTEQAKLLPSDGAANDIFGRSVAVSGDIAIVSNNRDSRCPFDPDFCSGPGSAYAFKRNGLIWEEKTILEASDGEAGDQFGGYNISFSGTTAVVGAPEDDNEKGANAGSAYIFELYTETVNVSSVDAGNSAIEVTAVTFRQNGTFECAFDVASASTGLMNHSSFGCYLDFDNEEFETDRSCDANGDSDLFGSYRLGENGTCDTYDIGLHYRVGKTGGSCTGLTSVVCDEEEVNASDEKDDLCNGTVDKEDAVSCRITITADPEDIAYLRYSLCDTDECLTNKDGSGNYDAYLWATSKLKSNRDRIPDTDDNDKPNSMDEVVRRTLNDPSL